MINTCLHNLTARTVWADTHDYFNDGVVLTNSSLPQGYTSLATLITDMQLDGNHVENVITDYLSYLYAMPWIANKLLTDKNALNNITYKPEYFSITTFPLSENKTSYYLGLAQTHKSAFEEVMMKSGYYPSFIQADTDEEKLCWVLLAIATQTKFYI